MKKLVVSAVIALFIVYGVGYFKLSTGGVNDFLNAMVEMTNKGDAQGLCDQLASDMKVSIIDHTAAVNPRSGDEKFGGGKDAMCARIQAAVPMLAAGGMSVQSSRDDLQVKREFWLHPWTAEVSYSEKQTTTIRAARQSIEMKTESDDKLLLEMTMTGVKIKRLESEQWLQ